MLSSFAISILLLTWSCYHSLGIYIIAAISGTMMLIAKCSVKVAALLVYHSCGSYTCDKNVVF